MSQKNNQQWYFKTDLFEYGPYTSKEMKEFVENGQITDQTLVRVGTQGGWLHAVKVKGLIPGSPKSHLSESNRESANKKNWPHKVIAVCLVLISACLVFICVVIIHEIRAKEKYEEWFPREVKQRREMNSKDYFDGLAKKKDWDEIKREVRKEGNPFSWFK